MDEYFLVILHRRRNEGGRGGHGPPDFKIYAFGPPRFSQIFTQEISLHQLGNEHVLIISFSCVTCMHKIFFAKPRGGDIVHSYMEV